MSTLNLSLTIPNTFATEVLNDFCAYHSYTEKVLGKVGVEIPNPETKPQFAKRKVADFVRESIKAYPVNKST